MHCRRYHGLRMDHGKGKREREKVSYEGFAGMHYLCYHAICSFFNNNMMRRAPTIERSAPAHACIKNVIFIPMIPLDVDLMHPRLDSQTCILYTFCPKSTKGMGISTRILFFSPSPIPFPLPHALPSPTPPPPSSTVASISYSPPPPGSPPTFPPAPAPAPAPPPNEIGLSSRHRQPQTPPATMRPALAACRAHQSPLAGTDRE